MGLQRCQLTLLLGKAGNDGMRYPIYIYIPFKGLFIGYLIPHSLLAISKYGWEEDPKP